MQDRNSTKIWALVAVLVLLFADSHTTLAAVVYNDGGVHDIDFPISDTVEVWDFASQPTTVNLLAGGIIALDLNTYNTSKANISVGYIGRYLGVYNSSQVAISGGIIKVRIGATNNCQLFISGGSVPKVWAGENSQVTISGGLIANELVVSASSQVIISGGTISKIKTTDSTHIFVSGGYIGNGIEASGGAKVTISGGEVRSYTQAAGYSQVTISGGLITSTTLYASDISSIVIRGFGFNYPFGAIKNSAGFLTGTLASGDPIANNFSVSGDASILLMPVYYYVDTANGDNSNDGLTPKTAFATIQKGIDTAQDGNAVMVLAGTYAGEGNRDLDFKGKAITVRSEDPNDPNVVAATIIDCNGSETDPHRGFYFHTGEDANSILEGFTITNGYGPNEPFGASTYSAGGAIYCISSSPTIRNCVFANNYSHYWGGGMWFDNSHAVIEDCIFQDNVALDTGGGLYNRSSSITLKDCQFVDNSADYGGGIYTIDGASSVRNTLFIGNLAAINGGGLRNKRVASTISNCTFFDNQAPAGAAVHNVLSEGTTITNCILWGNPDTEIEGDAEVTYSDIQGGYPGDGNIDADPCFANVHEDDFHLRSQFGRWEPTSKTWVLDTVTSPCIDRGDPSEPVGDEPNPNRNRINQGAYGGTAEASKSPDCTEALLSDLNHDCRVDFLDFAIFVSQWLECRIEPPDFCWW